MVNDEFADSDFEGPRRTTFEPPDDDVVYTNSSSVTEEDSTDEPPERASLTSYLPAPVRTYRTEEEIVAEFDRQGAGSTGDMIEELQKQISCVAKRNSLFPRGQRPSAAPEKIELRESLLTSVK